MITEADTCRKYVLKKLYHATWTDDQIQEQKTFTDGRIVVIGRKVHRRPQKRADYILRYRRDYPIAVVEAKAAYKLAGDAVQQAKDYALILGLKFAYATNGDDIIEIDFTTGTEAVVAEFPTPEELWARLRTAQGISDDIVQSVLAPLLPSDRQESALLPGNRHQSVSAGHSPGQATRAVNDGYRHW